jgi:hypothetical protein
MKKDDAQFTEKEARRRYQAAARSRRQGCLEGCYEKARGTTGGEEEKNRKVVRCAKF